MVITLKYLPEHMGCSKSQTEIFGVPVQSFTFLLIL